MHWYFLISSYYLTVSNGHSLTVLKSIEVTQCSGSFKWGEGVNWQIYPKSARFELVSRFAFASQSSFVSINRNERPMRSKVEPATNRIKRLLEVLSAYSFNLYYVKGKDMILSDFLSGQDPGDEDTNEIIPISFNMKSVLQDKYYNVSENEEKYMVQTRSQMKASGVQLPEVHGSRKRLDPIGYQKNNLS